MISEQEMGIQPRDKKFVEVTAIWTRRNSDHVETLVEIAGAWVIVSRELLDSPFSHIAEAAGESNWPLDPLTQGAQKL